MDSSFERLSADEQTAFQRLAVFEGPFTLKAALAVISCAELSVGTLPSLLSRLVSVSLLMVEPLAEGGRFHLLHTTRAYAMDKLRRSGQWPVFHRRYVLQGAWESGVQGPNRQVSAWSSTLASNRSGVSKPSVKRR